MTTPNQDNAELDTYYTFEGEEYFKVSDVRKAMAAAVLEAQLDLLDRLDSNPQMFGDWEQVIEDERAALKKSGGE